MKEITKFKKKYLSETEQELEEETCAEDLSIFVYCKISHAIDKAYKIGKDEN